MTSAGAATDAYTPSDASPNVMERYCLGMVKMALAATDAITAGRDVCKKNRAFLREMPRRTRSKRWQCGKSKNTSTAAAATSMATMAISRFCVAP